MRAAEGQRPHRRAGLAGGGGDDLQVLVLLGAQRRPAVRAEPGDNDDLTLYNGAGLRRGLSYGNSEELGFHAVEDPVHVHDLQATILHLLGFDHELLTFRFQGRDLRLTDVFG